MNIERTEKLLKEYFENKRRVQICEYALVYRREYIIDLDKRIQDINRQLEDINFSADVQSPSYSLAMPQNQQPPKGLDKELDILAYRIDKLTEQKAAAETEIFVTEIRLQESLQKMVPLQAVMKTIDKEKEEILYLYYEKKKSFENIGEQLSISKSAAHVAFRKAVYEVDKWV